MSAFNNACPFCGGEDLRGTVEEISGNVPLRKDGPDQTNVDDDLYELEVTYIKCQNPECLKEIEPDHYFRHGDPNDCDCNEETPDPQANGQREVARPDA